MKHKLLYFTFVLLFILSLFCISSFAAEEPTESDQIIIPSGTYIWNDNIDLSALPNDVSFSIPIQTPQTFSITADGYSISDSPQTFGGVMKSYLEIVSADALIYLLPDGSGDGLTVYDDTNKWNCLYNVTVLFGMPIDDAKLFGKVFTVLEDTSVPFSIGSWFTSSTSSLSTTVYLPSGYYRLKLPIDFAEPTWFGDRNTVWYNMRGRVITEDSNRALSFYRLGIRYFVNEGADYGAGVWGIELRIDTNNDTNLEIMSITFDNNSNQFYWAYNDLVLDSFVGIALDGNYEVNEDFLILFQSLFEPYEYVYTANPWFDIVDGVVDALKIDVFGSFSPWDILVTFIGISVFIWLLKLLAGG